MRTDRHRRRGRRAFSLSRLTRYALQGTALGLVMTAVILLVTTDANTLTLLRTFPLRVVPVMFLMVAVAWVCAGTRIFVVARSMDYRLRYRDALTMGLASEFGVAASPAGIGGAVVRLSYLHRGGVPMDAALTIFAADSLLDTFFFILLTPAALAVVLGDPSWRGLFGGLAGAHSVVVPALGVLLCALVLAIVWRNRLFRGAERLSRRLPWAVRLRIPVRLRHGRHVVNRTLRNTVRGAHFLLHARRSALIISFALAALQWMCRYGILPVILYAFGTARNPLPLLVLQGAFFALALVMVLPGGGGGIELLTMAVLRYFVPLSLVGVVVLMWRFFTYHHYLVGGGIAFSMSFHRTLKIRVRQGGHTELIRRHREHA